MSSLLLRLHLLVVLTFLLFYALKAALLLTGRLDTLRTLRARTRVADSVLGLLILTTGGTLLWQHPAPTPTWLWLKLALVLGLLPLAIAAMRRQHKTGVVLTLLGFGYVYGLAETGSVTLQPATQAPARTGAPAPGRAEAEATPDAAAPVDTLALSATGQALPDSVPAAAGPAETPVLAAGQALYTQHCAVCHGPDGRLGLNGAYDLTKSNLTAAGRIYQVTNGSLSKKMPAFKDKLSEEQIRQVAEYSLTLR
ncbi:c-type cytochrome [Hymenobacter sp. NST-14]|uniref:c-type cytochrome n=1 Tax=Hymenobacter piscis TaxID=2839984 RepID=UPI001C01EB1E|nr:cytochrome c [Hymenobacter piscis]MBT9393244.1 c-type cytochrome [Hymenobacter piscis]